MSRRGLRLGLAVSGAACLGILLAPPLAVGEGTDEPASAANVEGTVLAETETEIQYVRDRLVVGFEETASAATKADVIEDAAGTVTRSLPAIDASVVKVEDGQTDAAVATLEASPAVEYVEPEVLLQVAGVTPNDSLWSQQWGPKHVRAQAAWEATRGSASVVVAVLDTGVDANHPDLDGALVAGFDIVGSDSRPQDDNGHGTAAAGVIAARTNNAQGQAGVCWKCAIMPVKVLGANGSGTTSAISSGILWAVNHGADVINLSLGGTGTTSALADAVAYAASQGVVVVAAAGNNGNRTPFYPAAYPEVISVAATTSSDRRYDWSNYGSWVHVAAPGCDIAPQAGGGYVDFCGTSAATPVVSGIAGLAYSLDPALAPSAFANALWRTAAPVGSFVQYGRVDAVATLEALGLTRPRNIARPAIRGTQRVGRVLEVRKGTWAGNPTRFSYTWLRCSTGGRACKPISDADATTYRLRPADRGSTLRVRVRAANANGGKTATSAPTSEIRPPAAARPTIAAAGASGSESLPSGGEGGSRPPAGTPPAGGDAASPPQTGLETVTSDVEAVLGEVEETATDAVSDGP